MEVDDHNLLSDQSVDTNESDNEEKALELEVIELEKKIAENKFAYQPYIDLINVLKTLADLDRIRLARKKMAAQFPLSSDLWMDWLQDEMNLATTPEEKRNIIVIFQTAVKDYLSVDIWLQYVTFVMFVHNEESTSDFECVRKVFEEGLTAAGLHVTKGSLLWDAYIKYEKSLLNTFESDPLKYEKQIKLIGNLYKRQLSCPLWGMETTFENFQKWIAEISNVHSEQVADIKIIESIYKKAREKLEKIKPFEEALVSGTKNTLEIYKEYLDHEKSKEGSPVRVQCLYERILCDHCLDEEVWLEYINYVNTILNNKDDVLNICQRALRNCPWCCRLYQVYIRILEKYEQPKNLITEIVEDAFASGLQTATDFRDIWMTYLEFLRRSFDSPNISKEEEKKRLEDLRMAFGKAIDYLAQLPDSDPECTIPQFWARIEANYCKNMVKFRELWNMILSNEQNKTSEMWLEYVHLERTFGDSKHLRKLFPRALQSTKDWPEVIGKAWINYERDEGTLESYENCINKVKVRLKQMQELREKESVLGEQEQFTNYSSRKSKKSQLEKEKEKNELSLTQSGTKKITGYKRKQPNLDEVFSPTKKLRQNEKEESSEAEDKKQSNEEFVKKLLDESKTSHGETVIHDSSKDNRTVFVSNLDFATEESTIREAFTFCGHITDLRLVKDYKGRSKGYCYVEFSNPKEAESALKKDRELVNGRPMFVSKCDPDKETRSSGFKYSSSLEKNKLFVRGLPFATTAEELRGLFSKYGALKDVRLVTYRNGHSKGLAYVEFENEISATQAVLKTDGTIIEGKQISVAISNPPGRKADGSFFSKTVPSLGGGPKETGPRGKGRTQISFLPRSVQLNKPTTTEDSLANLSIASPVPEEQKMLNNSDFRRLLN